MHAPPNIVSPSLSATVAYWPKHSGSNDISMIELKIRCLDPSLLPYLSEKTGAARVKPEVQTTTGRPWVDIYPTPTLTQGGLDNSPNLTGLHIGRWPPLTIGSRETRKQ